MQKNEFKRINIDSRAYKYLIFKAVPEKKLLNTIKNLKDVFPNQKYWVSLEGEEATVKKDEILTKFEKKGKLFKELAKYWLNTIKPQCDEFQKFMESFELEISTEEVVKFFNGLKEKYNMNSIDVALFVHIYLEQVVGMQLFEESTKKLENELNDYYKTLN